LILKIYTYDYNKQDDKPGYVVEWSSI